MVEKRDEKCQLAMEPRALNERDRDSSTKKVNSTMGFSLWGLFKASPSLFHVVIVAAFSSSLS